MFSMQCRKNITVDENKKRMKKKKKKLGTIKIFLSMKIPCCSKPPDITRSHIEHCNNSEKIKAIILSHLSGAFPHKVNQ